MIDCDICKCGASDIKCQSPEGWETMTERIRNYYMILSCVACGTILKPYGTYRAWDEDKGMGVFKSLK